MINDCEPILFNPKPVIPPDSRAAFLSLKEANHSKLAQLLYYITIWSDLVRSSHSDKNKMFWSFFSCV